MDSWMGHASIGPRVIDITSAPIGYMSGTDVPVSESRMQM